MTLPEIRSLAEFLLYTFPLRRGKGEEITIEVGDDELLFLTCLENFAVARRDGDAPFVIHDIKIAPPEHLIPYRPNFIHIEPLSPTGD